MVPPLIRRIISIVVFSSVICYLSSVVYAQETKTVRVAVMQDIASLRLKISGFYDVIDSKSNKVIYRGKALNTTVMMHRDGMLLGNIRSVVNKILVRPDDPDDILINGRAFRGNIELIKQDALRFMVINFIDLEDYIKGISIREISHYWPPEALKAEVIAFRAFAVYKIEESLGKDYDLTSDIYSQVYGGRAAERYRINKAVDETKGLVLIYQGKIIPAFYHATCGGHTEDVSMLWNINIAPLKGVVCNFCKDSPHFQWHYVASTDEIKEKLASSGYKIKDIKDITIMNRDASGRITDLNIVSADKNIKISAKDFRNIIGPNVIKSTNFQINVIKGDVVFEGLGWGHGVGLCQWGAYFMAKEGYTCEQILKYYYPGSEISPSP